MSNIKDISEKIDRFDKTARQEKLQSPQIIQKTKAVRFPGEEGFHKAYCKTDAGAEATIICYLDEDLEDPPQDPPPIEITVNCNISDGDCLDTAVRRLKDGDCVIVGKIGNEWWATEGFQHWEPCA